jgi:hypothetical protein
MDQQTAASITMVDVWVGFAVNIARQRRKLVKVWANPPAPGNYRGDEVANYGNIIVYEPGSWRNSSAAPGCPVISPNEYADWRLVVVRMNP